MLVVFCLIGSPVGISIAYGQEGGYPIQDTFEEVDPGREKVANSPAEVDPLPSENRAPVAAIKDVPATTSPARQRPAENTDRAVADESEDTTVDAAQDDSLLNFNFLYYLFEKYKLQDIVD